MSRLECPKCKRASFVPATEDLSRFECMACGFGAPSDSIGVEPGQLKVTILKEPLK